MSEPQKPAQTHVPVAFMTRTTTPAPKAQAGQHVDFGHAPGLPQSVWSEHHKSRAAGLRQHAAALPQGTPERVELETEAAHWERRAVTGGDHSREARDATARAANIERSRNADS